MRITLLNLETGKVKNYATTGNISMIEVEEGFKLLHVETACDKEVLIAGNGAAQMKDKKDRTSPHHAMELVLRWPPPHGLGELN